RGGTDTDGLSAGDRQTLAQSQAKEGLSNIDDAGSFADDTGGDAIMRTSNFDGAVNRIWHESGSYYVLGYAPPINDHRRHTIEVRVKRDGVTLRARRSRE